MSAMKKFFNILFVRVLVKSVTRFYKILFAKRTILFVTNQKIRSITLGPVTQGVLILCSILASHLFVQSLHYNEALGDKADEISKLKLMNSYFEAEFEDVNEKLKKINEYLSSVAGNVQPVKAEEQEIKKPKNLKEEDLSRHDKRTLDRIQDVSGQLSSVKSMTQARIKKIEAAIVVTGLNIKKIPPKVLKTKSTEALKEISLNGKKGIADRQGGPAADDHSLDSLVVAASSEDDALEREFKKAQFTSELDYLMVLEKVTKVMPFAKPMKNYYISSGFGSRVDPMTRRMTSHQGLDFVGAERAKIISPSSGKVILAGRYSDYGNAIVIDHGFGVTTRYGHLAEVKVRAGQTVSRGDVIALQGSTGRSTGSHLHYEVRYKNTPLNPRRFLEAGETLFNDEKATKHVNS